MGFYSNAYIARIILNNEILIPPENIHFKSIDFEGNSYIDIPLNILSIENIRNDFKNFENLSDVEKHKNKLSEETNVLLDILRKIKIKSFLLESFTDFNPNYWIEDLLTIVIEDGFIIKETTMNVIDDEGHLIYEKYGYTDYPILYRNFEEAEKKYQKIKL